MTKQTIRKSVEISAPAEKVWEVLVTDALNRQWFAEFSPGTHAVTNWQPGNKITYIDDSAEGLVGIIKESVPGKLLLIEYTGWIVKGKEEYDTPRAVEMKGFHEIYTLSPTNMGTHLDIECDMSEEYVDLMSKGWDKALLVIKNLAET